MAYSLFVELSGLPDWPSLSTAIASRDLAAVPVPARHDHEPHALAISVPLKLATGETWAKLEPLLHRLLADGAVVWDLYTGQSVAPHQLGELQQRVLTDVGPPPNPSLQRTPPG